MQIKIILLFQIINVIHVHLFVVKKRELLWLGFTFLCRTNTVEVNQHCRGYMATFQLYWWRKTSGAFRILFKAQAGSYVEQPKLVGLIPHMKKGLCYLNGSEKI